MNFAQFEEWMVWHILWKFQMREQSSFLNVLYHSTFKYLKEKMVMKSVNSIYIFLIASQIYTRDPRPIPPCVMASSAMELNLGVFGFLPPTHAKVNANDKRVYDPLALVCLHAQIAVQLFWLWEKPKDPQIQPHARIKMAQVLGSLVCIWAVDCIHHLQSFTI